MADECSSEIITRKRKKEILKNFEESTKKQKQDELKEITNYMTVKELLQKSIGSHGFVCQYYFCFIFFKF